MAFGDNPCDKPLHDAWRAFCRDLESAGERVFKDYNPATEAHRVDAFRFLTQNLGQAFELALETRDTRYPALLRFCSPYRKLGGDAADILYQQAWIDGDSVYRLSGTRGTARFLNFTVQGERPEKQPGTDWPSLHDPFGDIPEVNLLGHELDTAADGSFELYLAGERRGPNWLPTTARTRKLFIRQGFDDWDEAPASLSIERVDMAEPRPQPTADTMIEAMQWAGRFVDAVMRDWPDHPYHYSPAVDPALVNAFPPAPADGPDGADRKRGRAAASMCWELAPDEALVVEFDDHEGFWMLSMQGVFFNSLDYLYRPVSYTPSRTAVDSDGRIRLILCREDPGYHNWLDTQGLTRGNLIYRNFLGEGVTDFDTRLLTAAELRRALPDGALRITPGDRERQRHIRFDAIRRRYQL